ncbi:MAG: hypothetical protein ATN33_08420 [Epulopiscium sp. Nele67-Bin001]|nr:MAG: hypothetical protein BEN18_01340 [Epulopiscium sp. Nuni2H_MBin001]OON91873.1 MAG: hypothetical protein ATN33_08420 [Epulopiscium sp. Nele67-Bin001]
MLSFISNREDGKSDKAIDRTVLKMMRRGYLEMADINLSISNLYFQVESEVQSYYDDLVECE